MDQYQIDGAFLDGRMYATCDNAKHGCGVVNFEGKRVAGRDVWDGRLKAWRFYNLLQARKGYGMTRPVSSGTEYGKVNSL